MTLRHRPVLRLRLPRARWASLPKVSQKTGMTTLEPHRTRTRWASRRRQYRRRRMQRRRPRPTRPKAITWIRTSQACLLYYGARLASSNVSGCVAPALQIKGRSAERGGETAAQDEWSADFVLDAVASSPLLPKRTLRHFNCLHICLLTFA
jgi:hypothetical protein